MLKSKTGNLTARFYTCRCSVVDVIVDNDNVLQGIFFQDNKMKHSFSCYPELLCIDAAYKLLELRFLHFLMLIEDGNGQSIIVTSFLALNETEATFYKMVALFKKHNPQWDLLQS